MKAQEQKLSKQSLTKQTRFLNNHSQTRVHSQWQSLFKAFSKIKTHKYSSLLQTDKHPQTKLCSSQNKTLKVFTKWTKNKEEKRWKIEGSKNEESGNLMTNVSSSLF